MIGAFEDLKSENVALQIRSAFCRRRIDGRRKTMVFGLLLTALGLGTACALLYYCAVFALPVFIGMSVAFWALNTGAGAAGVLVGFGAGALVFLIGQLVFSHCRSVPARWMFALLFALPAAISGYVMVLQLSEFGVPSNIWRHAFATIGAVLIGFAAFAQLAKSSDEIVRGARPSL